MNQSNRWLQIGAMLAVLIALFVFAPKIATAFAVGILIIVGGYGFHHNKFNLGAQ